MSCSPLVRSPGIGQVLALTPLDSTGKISNAIRLTTSAPHDASRDGLTLDE